MLKRLRIYLVVKQITRSRRVALFAALSLLLLSVAAPAQAGPKQFFAALVRETGRSARDLVTFRHRAWSAGVLLKIGASLADAHSTSLAVRAGAVESHPWLYGRRPNTARVMAVDAPVDFVLIVGSHYLATRRPQPDFRGAGLLWIPPLAIPTAFQARAAYNNSRLPLPRKVR